MNLKFNERQRSNCDGRSDDSSSSSDDADLRKYLKQEI